MRLLPLISSISFIEWETKKGSEQKIWLITKDTYLENLPKTLRSILKKEKAAKIRFLFL